MASALALLLLLSVLPCAVMAETGGDVGGSEGWFQFESNVNGATVHVDGKAVGTTPYTMSVYTTGAPYTSAYVSEAGYYDSSSQKLTMPDAGKTNTYYFTLQPIPTPTQVTTGSIDVKSSPSGAHLYIDGIFYGTTHQLATDFSAGRHSVRLEKDNYEAWTGNAKVTAGGVAYISATLRHVPTKGSISVTSSPSDAQITIDGNYYGKSPMVIGGIESGSHVVELYRPGYYEWTKRVDVRTGRVTYIDRTLSPEEKPTTGTIGVSSTPSYAYVYLDGVYEGQTVPGRNFIINNVAPGSHDVTLKLSGYVDSSSSVNVNSGQFSSVESVLTPGGSHPAPVDKGSIEVTSSPTGANIYLNNENKGLTPLTIKDLTPGSYTVTLKLSGYQDWTTTAEVSASGVSSVSGTLTPVQEPTKSGAFAFPALAALMVAGLACALLRRKD